MSQYGPTQPPPYDAYAQGLDRLLARLDRLEARLADTDRRARTLAHPPHHEQIKPRRPPPVSSWDHPLPRIRPDSSPWQGAFVGPHRRVFGRPSHQASAEDHHLLPRQPPPLSSWDRPVFCHSSDVEDTDEWQQRTSWDPPPHRWPSEPATCWDLPTANFQYERSNFSRQQTVGNRFRMMIDHEGRRSRADEVELPRSYCRSRTDDVELPRSDPTRASCRGRIAEVRPQEPLSWDHPACGENKPAVEDDNGQSELPVAEVELPVNEIELPVAKAELPDAEAELHEAEDELPVAEAELHDATETPAIKAEMKAELHTELVAEALARVDQPPIVVEVLKPAAQPCLITASFAFISFSPELLQKLPNSGNVGCGIEGKPLEGNFVLVGSMERRSRVVDSLGLIHLIRHVFDPGGDNSPQCAFCFNSPRCAWIIASWYPP